MTTETAALISSEKSSLLSQKDPKDHGSIAVTTSPLPKVSFGPSSQFVTCTNCGRHIKTKVKHRANVDTHWIALVLLCLCWPCLCLPYCCNSCKVANHYCPRCNQYLGTYGSTA